MAYLLAHDLGTSADKAVLFRTDGTVVAEASAAYSTAYPFQNAAEQDPAHWWTAFCKATKELLNKAGCGKADILAVSFSAQMNSCLPLDSKGQPLRPAMIWADQRAHRQAEALAEVLGLDRVYALTGQRLSASYGIAKMAWMRENEPALYRKTAKFIQPKDYLIFQLTGKLVSDYSDASHLACLDLDTMAWSGEMLEAAGIRRDTMPDLLPSIAQAGTITHSAAAQCGLMAGTPVVMGGGDGPCATAGAGISQAGQSYCSLGTSAWIATLAQRAWLDRKQRTFNLVFLDGRQVMTLGATQTAGLALSWAIDLLYAEQTDKSAVYRMLDELVGRVPAGSEGVLFLPYLLGERSPWWNARASGSFLGLHPNHGRETLLKSVLEGVGLTLRLVLDALCEGAAIPELLLIGGGARNHAWVQILADIWQKPVLIPKMLQYAGSAGAALCAGIGVGVFDSLDAARNFNPVEQQVYPRAEFAGIYEQALQRMTRVYHALDAADYHFTV